MCVFVFWFFFLLYLDTKFLSSGAVLYLKQIYRDGEILSKMHEFEAKVSKFCKGYYILENPQKEELYLN